MKKAMVIFAAVFIMSFLIPLISLIPSRSTKDSSELVTLFSGRITVSQSYHLPFQDPYSH